MEIIARAEWGARPPKRAAINVPASARLGVAPHWLGTPAWISSHAQCDDQVRSAQDYHMDGVTERKRPWSDIAYSWLVCPHGTVYEGRGATWDQFANGVGDERGWYTACALIGVGEVPTAAMLDAYEQLVAALRFMGAGLAVKPHNYFKSTGCPGPDLTAWCHQWDAIPFPAEDDEMSADAERRIQQLHDSFFAKSGLDPEKHHFGEATLGSRHDTAILLPAQIAAISRDVAALKAAAAAGLTQLEATQLIADQTTALVAAFAAVTPEGVAGDADTVRRIIVEFLGGTL